MMRLYLLRHGLAVPDGTEGLEDDDRPLTPEGERRVRQVGRGLRRLGVKLDTIATSPLPRASKTAEIIANCLEIPDRLEVVDLLRSGGDLAAIEGWLNGRSEPRLMIVGHNPSLSELLGRLLVGPDQPAFFELRKAGIAALRGEPGGRFQVDWIARPKLFPDLMTRADQGRPPQISHHSYETGG